MNAVCSGIRNVYCGTPPNAHTLKLSDAVSPGGMWLATLHSQCAPGKSSLRVPYPWCLLRTNPGPLAFQMFGVSTQAVQPPGKMESVAKCFRARWPLSLISDTTGFLSYNTFKTKVTAGSGTTKYDKVSAPRLVTHLDGGGDIHTELWHILPTFVSARLTKVDHATWKCKYMMISF